MKYGKVWISRTPDCGENLGGYYCQVYSDEDMENQIDDFCVHPEDCDCKNDQEVDAFIENMAKGYSGDGRNLTLNFNEGRMFGVGCKFEHANDLFFYLDEIVYWLAHHNKNYTREQYEKIEHLADLLSCVDLT